jgi:hypothetical protein
VLNGQAFNRFSSEDRITVNQRLQPVICHVPVTISDHLAKGKEHRKEIILSLFHYKSTQSLNNTDPLLLFNQYATKSFINYIQTRERGASAGGASGGRGLVAGFLALSAQFSSAFA